MRTRRLALTFAMLAAAFGATLSVPGAAAPADAVTTPSLSTKEGVSLWYKTRYLPAMNTPVGWTGSVNGCSAGTYSASALYRVQQQMNAIRALEGLSPVTVAKSSSSQASALIMEANSSLSHSPPTNWKCYSKSGAVAAGKSNLALWYSGKAGDALDLYMSDPGDGNTFVGHRRWVLYPANAKVYAGFTAHANDLQVIGVPKRSSYANPKWVAWPRAGYSPTQLDPAGRWSVTSRYDNLKWNSPRVYVYKNGTRLANPKVYKPAYGYGKPTLVWQMPAEKSRSGSYKIVVKGATLNGKALDLSYTAKLFVVS